MAQPTPPNSKTPSDSQIIERYAKQGTAMRSLIEEQQKVRRRKRRIQLLVGSVIFLILSYLAITTFIFNPVEPGVASFQYCVPNNCEFFVRKVDISRDFPLPPTVITPGNEEATLWRALENGRLGVPRETVKSWMADYDSFVKSLQGAPVDPVRDLIGSEVCVAGRFADKGGIAATRYCIYLRVSWRIRAAMGLLKYEMVRNKFLKGVKVDVLDSGVWKVLPEGETKEIYLYRNSDLLMIASDEEWIKEANNLLVEKEGAFGLTSKFAEDIRQPLEQRTAGRSLPSNLQFYLNLDEYRKAAGVGKKWMDPASALMDERILAVTFHPDFIKDVSGVVRFEKEPRRRIAVDATFRTDGEKLQPFGRKILQEKWGQQLSAADIRLMGEMAPQAAFAAGAFAISGGDLTRLFEANLTVEDRRMCDDAIKSTGRYDSLKQFCDELGSALGDRVIVILRDNNYAPEPDDPEITGPEPAIALVFPQRDPAKIRALMDFIRNNRDKFGVRNVLTLDIDRAYKLMEYYNNMIPGNGEVAVVPIGADTGSNVIISNQAKLIRNIHRMWAGGSQEEDRPYSIDSMYKDLTDEQKGKRINWTFVASGPKFSKALKKFTESWMSDSANISPEQAAKERPAIFNRILREKYPNYTKANVPENVKNEIESLVDDELTKKQAAAKANISPEVKQQYDELLKIVAAVPGVATTLELELKRARVYFNLILE